MEILYKELPFPHVIIENLYSDFELSLIMKELDFLTQPWKLLSPEKTGSATAPSGVVLKQNNCIWLDDVYSDRSISDILTFSRKLFDKEVIKKISGFHYSLAYIKEINQDSTLLSYYDSADHYKKHDDSAVLTILTHLFKQPKKFSGGILQFPDYNYNLETVNNRVILFPSTIFHSVSEIILEDDIKEFSGFGRYTISQFVGLNIFKEETK